MSRFDPAHGMLGGFTPIDGTVEFYGRINSILNANSTVLDLGAGRAAWYFEDASDYRRQLRTIKGKVQRYIAADIDEIVKTNPTSDVNLVIRQGRVDLQDQSVDVIICDYVLEHVSNVGEFTTEVNRLLRPGGYFCARTPHVVNYVSLAARIVRNASHSKLLAFVQPERKAQDVFPTCYRMNTLAAIRRSFCGWTNYSYVYSSEPRYFFGSRLLFLLFSLLHKFAPRALTGNLFVFLQKPQAGSDAA